MVHLTLLSLLQGWDASSGWQKFSLLSDGSRLQGKPRSVFKILCSEAQGACQFAHSCICSLLLWPFLCVHPLQCATLGFGYTLHTSKHLLFGAIVYMPPAHTPHTHLVCASLVYLPCTHRVHTVYTPYTHLDECRVWLFACAGARASPRTPREMQKHMLTSSTVQPAVLREQARRREKRESAATSISQKGHACCWIDFNVVCAAILR